MVDDMRQQIGIGAAGDTLNIQMDDEVVRMWDSDFWKGKLSDPVGSEQQATREDRNGFRLSAVNPIGWLLLWPTAISDYSQLEKSSNNCSFGCTCQAGHIRDFESVVRKKIADYSIVHTFRIQCFNLPDGQGKAASKEFEAALDRWLGVVHEGFHLLKGRGLLFGHIWGIGPLEPKPGVRHGSGRYFCFAITLLEILL
jgi:hypothetical protein